MSNRRYEVVVENIDNDLLNKQRKALFNTIKNSDGAHKELLEGVEALLDHISDKIYHSDCIITKIEN